MPAPDITPDTPIESLLHAYVDGQLDDAGRFEVELFLRDHPDHAADVLADMSNNQALRLLATAPHRERPETLAAARRLESRLSRRSWIAPIGRIAAILAVFALGWALGVGWSTLHSGDRDGRQQVAAPRAEMMASLREALQPARLAASDGGHVDPVEVGKALQLTLPRIPKGWNLVELHIVPGTDGPGVQLLLDAPEFGRLALLAGSTDRVGITFPTVKRSNGENVALWQMVSNQYALTGNLPSKPLELAALELYQTLY